MSAPSTDQSLKALTARPHLLPWLAVLLPFTALGLLPWWVCLALSAALALGKLNDDSRSVGGLLALLAAVLVSAPMLFGAAPDRLLASGTLFAQAAVVGLLALGSLRALENGQRRGLLLPAAALLLFPSPGGLVALLVAGLALNGAETRPTVRLEHAKTTRNPARRMLTLLLAAALGLAGAGLLLGQVFPTLPRQTLTAPAHAGAPRPSAPRSDSAAGIHPASGSPGTRALQSLPLPDEPSLLRPLIPVTGLLIVLCMVLLLQRARMNRAERRSTWTDYAALAALLGTLFMVGVIGAGAQQGGLLDGPPSAVEILSGSGATGAVVQAGRRAPVWVTPLLNAGLVFATLFFAAAAVYLFLALRAERGQRGSGPAGPVPVAATPDVLPPLHRVRLAWRGLEAVLADAGLTRLVSETPEDFSSRLSGLLPTVTADLHTLTRLYLPVRYGGVLSESDAAVAEASAERVRLQVEGQDFGAGRPDEGS